MKRSSYKHANSIGYSGDRQGAAFSDQKRTGGVLVEIWSPPVESSKAEQFIVRRCEKRREKARRWVVERSHSWMNRFRRILVRWEKRADTYLAMVHFACAIITWRACGLLG
jgi:transposase